MKDPYTIVRRPLVTEKSMTGAAENKYTFEVDPGANKIEIGVAIEKIFNVKVQKVNTLRVKGKTKRLGRYPEGKTPDMKKAIVTLAPGQRIEIFEGM
ncbi:MAG TPA: 50S ribosomal protein L23 [Armatimonadota bacterium]|jgi:large subunit ribosomal protein L23|nr:50S ribosomal protein L23 [Armatimonadota bacterium]HOP81238.1 50S ribosomal protein L23 [Armatimonadota bacterium]HPP76086.1 50S ribosomal protein L23 [Armatimonadota bacterium]